MSARLQWAGVALLALALILFIVGRPVWAGTAMIQPTATELAVAYGAIGSFGLGFALLVLGVIGKVWNARQVWARSK